MFVISKAVVGLEVGDRLRYDCPLGSDDYKAQEFFTKYRGKMATMVGFAEKAIGVLDHQGRLPGRYIFPGDILVRFQGEEEKRQLQAQHFVLLHPREHQVLPEDFDVNAQRVGELQHPILFYPDDLVRYKGTQDLFGQDVRWVRSIFMDASFTPNGVPRYQVVIASYEQKNGIKKAQKGRSIVEIRAASMDGGKTCTGEELELVSRGNVWALYNDPSKLSFKNVQEAGEFWSRDGICCYVSDTEIRKKLGVSKPLWDNKFGYSGREAYRVFESKTADIIVETFANPGDGKRYQMKLLHECFASHREVVREVTRQLWSRLANESAA